MLLSVAGVSRLATSDLKQHSGEFFVMVTHDFDAIRLDLVDGYTDISNSVINVDCDLNLCHVSIKIPKVYIIDIFSIKMIRREDK